MCSFLCGCAVVDVVECCVNSTSDARYTHMINDSNPVCEGVVHAAPVVVGGALHLLERGVEAAILQVVHEERGPYMDISTQHRKILGL